MVRFVAFLAIQVAAGWRVSGSSPAIIAAPCMNGSTRTGILAEHIYLAGADDARTRLAAKELRRYTHATTAVMPLLHTGTPPMTDGVQASWDGSSSLILATPGTRDLGLGDDDAAVARQVLAEVLATNSESAHAAAQLAQSGATLLAGATPLAVLYAAYEYASAHLGVYFAIDGDRLPRRSLQGGLRGLAAPARAARQRSHSAAQPRFSRRGALPYHDFPMGPVSRRLHHPRFAARGSSWFTAYPMGQDWWQADDYKVFATQLTKLKMNMIATHTYSIEPTVFVGTTENLSADGRIRGGVYNTTPWFRSEFPLGCIGCDHSNSVWGLANRSTSDYTCGSAAFFDADNYGSPLAAAYPTAALPNEKENKAAFEGAADLLKDAFHFARSLGVDAAIGVEVPLGITYPWALGREMEHFLGIFNRLKRLDIPIKSFWLYSSEGSMNAGVNYSSPSVQQIVKDAHSALAASQRVWPGGNVTIGMSGWMLGPTDRPYYFDKVLPAEVIPFERGHDCSAHHHGMVGKSTESWRSILRTMLVDSRNKAHSCGFDSLVSAPSSSKL